MLDYARQRAMEALIAPRRAVLVTSGPAGVQLGEFPCEAVDLDVYLLIPQTSDHLFNLEHASNVTLLTSAWELTGQAEMLAPCAVHPDLGILREAGAAWSILVRVSPYRLQIRKAVGWGNVETIDLC